MKEFKDILKDLRIKNNLTQEELAEKVGLKKAAIYKYENGINKTVTPHMLRHTHISLLAQADVSLVNIKARIGHGDGKVTEKIYLHITKESQNKALEKFEGLF